jgi:hypothetical protein
MGVQRSDGLVPGLPEHGVVVGDEAPQLLASALHRRDVVGDVELSLHRITICRSTGRHTKLGNTGTSLWWQMERKRRRHS